MKTRKTNKGSTWKRVKTERPCFWISGRHWSTDINGGRNSDAKDLEKRVGHWSDCVIKGYGAWATISERWYRSVSINNVRVFGKPYLFWLVLVSTVGIKVNRPAMLMPRSVPQISKRGRLLKAYLFNKSDWSKTRARVAGTNKAGRADIVDGWVNNCARLNGQYFCGSH